jgi:redox-sensitive bicupin YhaK (pirin superfamily)
MTRAELHTPPADTVRPVLRIVRGMPASDGAGVRLTRMIGGPALPQLDPFLLLDEICSDDASDYLAGFPSHRHRGFETVTYMLAARDKMIPPRYQDIDPADVPELDVQGARVRVVAGRIGDVTGPVHGVATEPVFLDVSLPAGARLAHALPDSHTSFVFACEGEVRAGTRSTPLHAGELAVLGEGARVELATDANPARLLLIAGRPLREPSARYGPFVMNSEAEILQDPRLRGGRL